MEFIILRRSGSLPVTTQFKLPEGFSVSWWRVTRTKLKPPGKKISLRYLMSWLLYLIHGQRKAYRALLVRDGEGRLGHVSVVSSRDFKEAFMGPDDLQIGRTFTEPEYRGLGLAKYAVQEMLRSGLTKSAYYWYVVVPTNTPSIRVAKANGFEPYGCGRKKALFGLTRLGRIIMEGPWL